ncbi:MAG TPA: transglutaminase N-terminal domain-containing protein [Steroidobacteraceae bacterium]|jgi:transglutaminase-like putative cysteine protease|nr:transglutaminase N-terminal domain-containing protein [Steroidobacteraceae bacterium]
MSRRLRIQHTCEYRYSQPFQYSAQALRLTPRRDNCQHALNWTLHTPGRRVEQVDAHGNITHLLSLEAAHRQLEVVVTGVVEITWSEQPMPHEGQVSPQAYLAATALTRPTREVLNLGESLRPENGANWEWITGLGRTVRERQPADAPSADIAHAFLTCCRAAGVPGRYVSGYRQEHSEEGAARIAWVDVWCASQAGWIALDVERLEPARSRHCRLAVGRDYLDAAPVRSHRPGESVEFLRIRE